MPNYNVASQEIPTCVEREMVKRMKMNSSCSFTVSAQSSRAVKYGASLPLWLAASSGSSDMLLSSNGSLRYPGLPLPTGQKPSRDQTSSLTQSQLNSDHYGLEKIKRRISLSSVILKKAIDEPAAGTNEAENQNENARMALIKAGEIPAPPQMPRTSTTPVLMPIEGRETSRPPFCCESAVTWFVIWRKSSSMCLASSGLRVRERLLWFNRLLVPSVGRSSASLLGVRDEAEIRSHWTYVASGPGLLAQALCKAGRIDPVFFLIDDRNDDIGEINKVGQSNDHCDPSLALRKVLDPEQNVAFNDYYLNVPIDLSQILFICTASTLGRVRRQTRPAAFLTATPLANTVGTSKALVKRSKNDDASYNPVVEAESWRRFLGCRVMTRGP
ncbi:hypothetical protein V8E53_000584 [Lactarius tabidus]